MHIEGFRCILSTTVLLVIGSIKTDVDTRSEQPLSSRNHSIWSISVITAWLAGSDSLEWMLQAKNWWESQYSYWNITKISQEIQVSSDVASGFDMHKNILIIVCYIEMYTFYSVFTRLGMLTITDSGAFITGIWNIKTGLQKTLCLVKWASPAALICSQSDYISGCCEEAKSTRSSYYKYSKVCHILKGVLVRLIHIIIVMFWAHEGEHNPQIVVKIL